MAHRTQFTTAPLLLQTLHVVTCMLRNNMATLEFLYHALSYVLERLRQRDYTSIDIGQLAHVVGTWRSKAPQAQQMRLVGDLVGEVEAAAIELMQARVHAWPLLHDAKRSHNGVFLRRASASCLEAASVSLLLSRGACITCAAVLCCAAARLWRSRSAGAGCLSNCGC